MRRENEADEVRARLRPADPKELEKRAFDHHGKAHGSLSNIRRDPETGEEFEVRQTRVGRRLRNEEFDDGYRPKTRDKRERCKLRDDDNFALIPVVIGKR